MEYLFKCGKAFVVSGVAIAVLAACGSETKKTEVVVPPVAVAPVAKNDVAISLNNAVTDIDVLANDVVGSEGPLTLVSVTAPGKGQVSIVDKKLRYTPPATFLGSDTFTYTVASGAMNATATVTVSGHQSLNLKGRVIDSPIADATVKVTVNGETFTATADSQGFYTLAILLTSAVGDEVIRVVAQGAEKNNQAFVTLSSLTQTASELLALRNPEQTIGEAELASVKLTQITTARDLLIQQISGKTSLTPAQLAEAQISLDVEKLITTAAAIKLLIDNPSFKLPDGFDSIEKLVLNPTAFSAFIQTANQGENSPLKIAQTETLSDPNIVPQTKPLSGNYLRIFDTPSFMSARTFENINFGADTLTVINQTNTGGEFSPVTKSMRLNGNIVEVIDPEETGIRRTFSSLFALNFLADDAARAAWQANRCPTQISVETFSGYKQFNVIEQTETYFTAEVKSFLKQVPSSSNTCAGITPQPRYSESSVVTKFVSEASLISGSIPFDLTQTQKWILPELKGSPVESELYTLKNDGTFETFTDIYAGSLLTWNLSEDKKTLSLKNTNAFDTGEFNQMDLRITRALDSAYTVLAIYKNEESNERYASLKSILPITGDGVANVMTATVATNKFILSSVNSRNKEWDKRDRLPGDWFGWSLTSDTQARSPSFTCDGVRPDVGSVCVGEFKTSASSVSAGTWEVKDKAIHIERGLESAYQNGSCVRGEPCNLRVMMPLYQKDGVITGYEYNIIRRNQFQIMPRVMHWTIKELPPSN